MNLACKAVLEKVTDMDCAGEESDMTIATYAPAGTFDANIINDPIAVICNVVCIVSNHFLTCSLS